MQLNSAQHHLLTLLRVATRPLTAYALLDGARDAGVRAPTQVYRALEKLMALGLVHRLDSLNAYVACTQPLTCRPGHAAFAICDDCGAVDEFDDAALGRALGRWARSSAFALRKTAIELHGQCAACAGAP
ncbi:MAG: hypothetical protein RL244_2562 [Pseudomonadota bacterium]|jgi:Fur family zinc uptake transcriptional regulator